MSEQMNDMHADGQQADWQRGIEEDMLRNLAMPLMQLVRGEGSSVWDSEGNRYLDFLSGIAVLSLGHAHPVFVEAVSSQAATLAHVSNYFSTPPQIALARTIKRLAETGPEGRVYFCNSGTEANEAALKLTRLHKPGGKVLSLTHSFHGRTMGALSVTEKPVIREPFEPLPGNVEFVEPTIAALTAAFNDDVAGIFVEPIQGEAGVLPLADGVLAAIRELCDKHGALLVVDEVQTGIGRTGVWLASQQVRADVVTLAKGLGGGFPIGACVGVGAAGDIFGPGSHGSTFAGNPVASAAARATLTEVENLLGHVAETGAWLRAQLEAVGYQVRGAGLLLGVEVADSAVVHQVALEAGFIVNAPNGTTIRLAPPLIITEEQLVPFISFMTENAQTFVNGD